MARALLIFVVIALVLPAMLPAQDSATVSRKVRVFFDCNADCDEDYIRTETPWVDFVRDRTDADVHMLITSLGTGAGGERYTINFVGLGLWRSKNDTLRYDFPPGETDDVGRRGLTRVIQLGLAPFVARTPVATRMRMSVEDATADMAQRTTPATDPWRSWVFETDAYAFLEDEARQSRLEWGAEFDASRITSRWKFGTEVETFFAESKFLIDDDTATAPTTITSLRESYEGGVVLVKSLGRHWGAGMSAAIGSSTFSNTRLAVRAAPALEFSVFPYDDFTRRQLTVQYSIGVSSFKYRETTIFGRLSETRPTHALVVGYDVNQPWGSAEATLETARYLDNSSQWRLVFGGDLEVRVARGLSIEIGGGASLIRDQLAIAARNATPEEILLELRDLQTDHRYNLSVGLSYTFGSIFNAVVNPRFGTGPGEILR
ncbi:MAG TPA: hypothetical protein VEB19_10120 [Gemmatimonadaceae bacterium]|nr:hypothetical protein [Gemmatimonadaceae bacterium]